MAFEHVFYACPMKGGMSRGTGIRLQDRVRTGRPPPADQPGADQPGADQPGADQPGADQPGADQPRRACPARHVWVSMPVDATEARPGLLLEWRKAGHRWEGRVAYLAELRPGRWSLVEEWLAAELLTQA